MLIRDWDATLISAGSGTLRLRSGRPPGPARELGLDGMATSARLKMMASLPPGSREQADRVASRLHIDTVDWYRAQETPEFLREVADAVWVRTVSK